MKNFLSKLWSLSRADRVRTLAIDAVSLPSFCRVNMLKLVSVLVLVLTLGVGNAWGVEATFNLWQTAPGSPTTNNNVSFAYSGCVFGASNANAGFNVNGQVVATMPTGATVTKIVVHKTSNAWAKKANLKVYYGNTLKQTITQPSSDVTINLNGSEQTAGTYKFKNEGSDSKVAFVKSIVITYTVSECSNPEIGTQPASATYTVGDSPTALSVTASGTSLTYQWYSNTTATNTGGTIITGQTSSTYTPSTASNGTFYYYCVVSSGSCSTNSNVATITVNKASATIKLSEAGAESTVSGTHYSGDSYTLPSSTEASCGSKVLVGWSTVTISETDTKPTSNYYDKGASVTLAAGENKFYAVFATESGGDPVSISGGDMASSLPSGWSSTGTDGFYTNNGVKFNSTGDYILSGDISSHGLTSVTVKFKAGYNGSEGSVLRIEAIDEEGYEIGGVNFTPTEAYNAQSTINSVVVSASGTIYNIAVEMTEKTSNVGVKYCEVFKGGTTYSAYSTTCCNQLAAPANPGETPNSTGAVLTWDAVTGATGYEVKIDGGEWTSTGNGTTTGYTITGKACGGTSVSWQVRATGDGSTNCAKGAATTARNFTTTACACTNQYTYFWGTQITNDNPSSSAYASHHFECFNTWNGSEGKTGLITLPNSDTENYWFVGYNGYYYNSNLPGGGRSWCTAIYDMNYANSQSDGKVLGWNSTAYPRGATGYIRIYSDNTNSNKYAAFIPSGYILRWKNNRNSDAWTSYPFTDTGASNYWETDLVQLGADLSSDKVWVGLPTSGMSESFTWCGKSEEKNLIGVGKKTGASTWAANGIVAGDANQWGKWRIEVTNNATNWNVHFVPYWKATYDVNGGGAISPTTANEGPVSCEGNATQRQVTMPAAPTYAHHDFGGWKSSADNSINAAGATVSLTQNTTFTAQWTNSQYNITATLTNVTSETSFPVAYTYTGSAANVTYAFEASSGYRLPDNVTVTGSTYSWNKNSGELTLTGTITGAVSITISGTQTHTVTWLSNGSNYVTPVDYTHGAALALPAGTPSAPGGCSDKVFVGWTSDPEISTETSTKPTIISAGGAVTGGATYRAVFADRGGSGESNTYTRLETVSELYDGMKIVIVASQNSGAYLQQTASGITKYTSSIPKSTDEDITVTTSSLIWTLEAGTGVDAGKWRLLKDASNKLVADATPSYTASGSTFSIEDDSREFIIYNGSCYGLEYYGTTPQWKFYSPSKCNIDYGVYGLWLYGQLYDNYITLCSTCTTPSDVAASGITTDGATITWNGTSQENNGGSGTGFVVKYGTNSTRDANSNTINVAAGTNTADLTGLAQGTKYYVWVQSKCDDSWSTTPAEFTTLVSHTATFIGADGSTLQSSAIVEGESVTYSGSTPVSCDTGDGASTTFVGWATDTWEGKVAKGSIVPTFIDIAGGESLPAMSTSDVTYHAVFAKSSGTPLTNHAWTYTFTTQTFKSNGEKTLSGTEGGDAVDKAWTIEAMDATYMSAITTWGSVDADKGAKFGKSDATDRVSYMYITSTAFTGTVTNVKVSTSGASGTDAELSVSVNSASYQCSGNTSVSLTNSNTEYNFTGSQTIAGNTIQLYWFQNESNVALYLKKIEVDYTTGGDVSYSNYMTTCSQCVTPNSVTADAITEAGATINWAGTSKTGTTGFTVLWGTDGTRANNSNSANVDADTKTYSITGLSEGTTYYVWVQSRCDGSWSDRISFTTKAIHTISFSADNGTISSGATIDIVNGETLTFPSVTSTTCGTFMGWTIGDYDNTAAPSPFYTAGAEMADITAPAAYKAVYRTASGAETLVTDNWTGAKTGVTTYDTWTKTDASAATYQGYTAKNSSYSNCIQMKSADSNSGIITTASGGDAKKVTITWNSNTTSGRTVDVYGKKAAYSSAADLYSAGTQGTKIGSIVYGTSTELEIDGDYQYIGLRSNSGALYIDNIAIQWYGSPMHYMTSPTCNPMVGITESLSSFTYAYGTGPSASQTFMVSGSNLGANTMTVTAPTNYEVSKDNSTFSSSVSYTPSDGSVAASTVYIRLAAGLSVGTYNYAQASGLVVACAGAGATAQKAALNGTVTKATGSIAFTDFNAVDHYEAEMPKGGTSLDVTLTVSVTGDGAVSYSRSPAAGSSTVPATTPTTTLHVTTVGTWTVTANLAAGTNYTSASTTCQVVVYYADHYYDNIHSDVQAASSITLPIEERGSYSAPYLVDSSPSSGNCAATHYKFMGWVSKTAIDGGLADDAAYKAALIPAGTAMTATGESYYAVWAEIED